VKGDFFMGIFGKKKKKILTDGSEKEKKVDSDEKQPVDNGIRENGGSTIANELYTQQNNEILNNSDDLMRGLNDIQNETFEKINSLDYSKIDEDAASALDAIRRFREQEERNKHRKNKEENNEVLDRMSEVENPIKRDYESGSMAAYALISVSKIITDTKLFEEHLKKDPKYIESVLESVKSYLKENPNRESLLKARLEATEKMYMEKLAQKTQKDEIEDNRDER
jgi:hypothetical protein